MVFGGFEQVPRKRKNTRLALLNGRFSGGARLQVLGVFAHLYLNFQYVLHHFRVGRATQLFAVDRSEVFGDFLSPLAQIFQVFLLFVVGGRLLVLKSDVHFVHPVIKLLV